MYILKITYCEVTATSTKEINLVQRTHFSISTEDEDDVISLE